MKKLYELTNKELIARIMDGDEYDLDAMKEYLDRKCINYENATIDEMYEKICELEGV